MEGMVNHKYGIFFHLMCFGWFIFRSKSLSVFLSMASSLVFNFHFDHDDFDIVQKMIGLLLIAIRNLV